MSIIHIDSYPGIKKLWAPAGRCGRILDNHSITTSRFAATEFHLPAFDQTLRAVRDIAYARVLEPAAALVILTNWYWQDSA